MLKLRLLILVLIVVLAGYSAKFLVIDGPRRSDVIVVLAGETDRRPKRGLDLLGQEYAGKMILDVPAGATLYKWSQLQLAEQYVDSLPQSKQISVCPIQGLSTKAEAQDARDCLQKAGGHNVLLVTSDYHTRRALNTFSKGLPEYQFSVAAAYDERQFGPQWWRHREWAKCNFDEWTKLTWWELVDRWR